MMTVWQYVTFPPATTIHLAPQVYEAPTLCGEPTVEGCGAVDGDETITGQAITCPKCRQILRIIEAP